MCCNFWISSRISDIEKVFAKKPGCVSDKETQFLILDKVEFKGVYAKNKHFKLLFVLNPPSN